MKETLTFATPIKNGIAKREKKGREERMREAVRGKENKLGNTLSEIGKR
ncbi:hypothetical protein [Longitalea arenae]|nr:hypothetical protein [Longitalea arenae]